MSRMLSTGMLAPTCALIAALVGGTARADDIPPSLPPPAEESPAELPPGDDNDTPRDDGPAPDERGFDDTPTPDEPGDIPQPPGYAPDEPQPFLRGPGLYFAQLLAGLGARQIVSFAGCLPVVGPLVVLVAAPAAEAAAIVLAGDRLGPYRSSLFWPVLASYLASAAVTVISVVPLVSTVILTTLAPAFLLLGDFNPIFGYAGFAMLGTALVTTALYLAINAGSVFIAPAVALAAYHFSRRPKTADDDGTGFPRILPRGKGIPLPRFGPFRPEEEEEDDKDQDDDKYRTPVSHRGGGR